MKIKIEKFSYKVLSNQNKYNVMDDYISVYELTHSISNILSDNLEPIYKIKGEIVFGNTTKITRHKNGNYYFNIKDEKQNIVVDCQLNKWHLDDKMLAIMGNLNNGNLVKIIGRIDYWRNKNKMSLVILDIESEMDEGLFLKKKQDLFDKYNKLGYFDKDNKKDIKCDNIKTIGLITAYDREAMCDFLKTLAIRKFTGSIIVKPSSVQGEKCPEEIVKAIEYFNNREKTVDIIIITRGGGSIFDLWGFNDEKVIKAIHDSIIPVGTGIGHEKDDTLANHVADCTGSTPTAIACKISYDNNLIINKLDTYKEQIITSLLDKFKYQKQCNKIFNDKIMDDIKFNIKLLKESYKSEIDKLSNYLENEKIHLRPTNILFNGSVINNAKEIIKLEGQEIELLFEDSIVKFTISNITISQKLTDNRGKIDNLLKYLANIKNYTNFKIIDDTDSYSEEQYSIDLTKDLEYNTNIIDSILNPMVCDIRSYEKICEKITQDIKPVKHYATFDLNIDYKIKSKAVIQNNEHIMYLEDTINKYINLDKCLDKKKEYLEEQIETFKLDKSQYVTLKLINHFSTIIKIINYHKKQNESGKIKVYKEDNDVTEDFMDYIC